MDDTLLVSIEYCTGISGGDTTYAATVLDDALAAGIGNGVLGLGQISVTALNLGVAGLRHGTRFVAHKVGGTYYIQPPVYLP